MCQSKSCQLQPNSVAKGRRTNPEQIEEMELEGYSQPTCNKLCASATMRSTIVGVSFVDHTIDLTWRNFLSPEFGAKLQREVPPFL